MDERRLADQVAGSPGTFLRDYLDYARKLTDAPALFHVAGGLVATAGAVGSNVSWQGGGRRENWPNLFVLLVAQSGMMRKSTTLELALDMLSTVQPGIILPNEFSPERFVQALSSRPTSVMKESEFASLLQRMQQGYMAPLKAKLTDLYDCQQEYVREIRGENGYQQIRVPRPALSILAASTLDWLVESLTETDMRSGFMPRFLLFPAIQKEPAPEGGYWAEPDKSLQTALLQRLGAIAGLRRATIDFAPAKRLLRSWAEQNLDVAENEDVPQELMGLYSRLAHHLAKVCALLQISDEGAEPGRKSYEVSPAVAERGIALLNWNISETERLFRERVNFSKFERQAQEALRYIGESTPRANLLRRMKVSASELDRVLKTLEERGEIETETGMPGARGRPTTLIRRLTSLAPGFIAPAAPPSSQAAVSTLSGELKRTNGGENGEVIPAVAEGPVPSGEVKRTNGEVIPTAVVANGNGVYKPSPFALYEKEDAE
jgi:hypothetical protein